MLGGFILSKIVSIPLFQVGVLFIVTSAIWFFMTDKSTPFKKKIFDFITDGLYYSILSTLALNVFFNFKEVIQEPYQAIIFSSQASWMALILVSIYLVYREITKTPAISNKASEQYIDHILNFFLLLALANHLFYYYKYRNIHSVIFVVVYFIFYLLKDRFNNSSRNELTLVLLAILHGLIMFNFSKIIIYYQLAFYPYQIISLLLIASLLIFYFRRNLSSKQK